MVGSAGTLLIDALLRRFKPYMPWDEEGLAKELE
jgi:hypothetical protein